MSPPVILRCASGLLFTLCSLTACHPGGSTSDGDAATGGQATPHDASGATSEHASASDAGKASPPDVANLNTDYKAWQASVDKLRSCGVYDKGVILFDPELDLRCESLCIVTASCADLKAEACDERPAKSLEDCSDHCPENDGIACGDGTMVPADTACDLQRDCANGEDEMHCETFTCKADSKVIGSYYVCDATPDCSDGADEVGCLLICGKPRVVTDGTTDEN